MGLETIQLDTLDWEQMVTAIRTRIVPDSQGKWTLHAPVDPGITLLELFAWLLDQRIYWMDQDPAALTLATLALLGDSPQAAQSAITVLQVADSAQPPRTCPVAAAGTLMQAGDSNPPLIFTLDDSLAVLPVTAIAVRVNGVDRSNDLAQNRPVPLLASGATSAQVEIVMTLSAAIPAACAGQVFSVFFELESALIEENPDEGDPPAQWSSQAAAGVAAPATLQWSYTGQAGATTAFAQVDDGTTGLRRSGIVRIQVPGDWQPEAGGPANSYKILLSIENAAFTYTPHLSRLKANAVQARHRWPRTKNPLTNQWLPLPGNTILLSNAPSDSSMQEYPPIEDTVQVTFKGQPAWTRVSDFSLSGPTDSVFAVNRARGEISFGNGLTGRLPVVSTQDASDVEVSYAAGGGAAGNVGSGLFWEAVPANDGAAFPMFTATNLLPGDGGVESESLDDASQRSAGGLTQINRAVSKADFEYLAQTTPGVAFRRAYAAVGYHPDFAWRDNQTAVTMVPGAVTVFVVPYAPRVPIDGDWASDAFVAAPQPDPGALAAAQARLDAAKLIGSDVFVCRPVYCPVWLNLSVAVDQPLSAGLRQQIIDGLQNFLDPLTGGDEQNGWPFGDPLRPSALARIAQTIIGSAGDLKNLSVRIDGMSASSSCKDVPIQPHELLELKHVEIATVRRQAPSGGLR